MKRRVLYVIHGHPVLRPGGAEEYAYELYQAMRRSEQWEPALVARTGETGYTRPARHPGAPFSVVGEDPNQYFVLTEWGPWDEFLGTYQDKSLFTTYFANFLRSFKPDLVHIQHTHFIGYDLVSLVRRMMPQVPIFYTLQEFLPICHRDGQMVRSMDESLCTHSSPRRCHECFQEWSPQHFFLRERFIKAHLRHVDLFLAPSKFLRERFIDWGIPREKIRFEDYGRIPQPRYTAPVEARPRTRLAYFGQISRFKGLEVLLEAMPIVGQIAPEAHLIVHGANLEVLPEGQRKVYEDALAAAAANVAFAGAYRPEALPRLMSEIDWVIVPSRWWENSPLVIQEAFMHGRPVICSRIGGMAEKVEDGVNGLHFQVSNRVQLAETIRRAVRTPGLWEQLCKGIPPVFTMEEHVANLKVLYEEHIEARAQLNGAPAALEEAG